MTTTSTTKTHRALASLKLPKPNPALITYAQGIVKGMTGNAYFTAPSPALAALSAAIADLQSAETPALTRAKGAAAARKAKPGTISGAVKLVAQAAAHRSSYEWEYSTDGGKTWVTMPPTLQAKTSITGLTPGSSVQFRYRAVTKAGAGDWSQPITMPLVK